MVFTCCQEIFALAVLFLHESESIPVQDLTGGIGLKAYVIVKRNIDTLLDARGQKRKDLAGWCRRSESWLSQIFTDDERNIPLKYLDRIADFFGIATYQLLQPGISALTERRSGRDRRTGMDRRISHAQEGLRLPRTPDLESVTPWERAFLTRVRRLKPDSRKALEDMVDGAILRAEADRQREDGASATPPPGHAVGTGPLSGTPPRIRKR